MRKIGWLLLVVMTLWGCSKKSPTSTTTTVIQTQSKFVVTEIYRQRLKFPYPGDWGTYYERAVIYSSPTLDPAQCAAEMRFGSTLVRLSQKWPWPGGVELRDSVPFPYPGVPCSLLVTAIIDTSLGGNVSLPGSYRVIAPQQGDTLPIGDITVSWSPASSATWYDLYLYYNSIWRLGSGEADTVLILSTTSAFIPKVFFQKDSAAQFWYIDVSVNAHGGDTPKAGASGNLVGGMKGAFYSTFVDTSCSRRFYMGTFPLAQRAMEPPQSSETKRRQFLLRAFGAPVTAAVK